MKVRVILQATLRENRFSDELLEVGEGADVRELVRILDIPTEDVGVVVVNGKAATYKQALKEGDRVSLIPSMAGG